MIRDAAAAIIAGGLVVFPTDTVFGIGCLLRDESAVAKIFAAKGRPANKGLIAMIADPADLDQVSEFVSAPAGKLIDEFWPGPLTIILPAAPSVPEQAIVGGGIGVRIPASPVALALIKAVGQPLATTSANRSGSTTAGGIEQARADLADKVDVIIDSGPAAFGIESTVVDPTPRPPLIHREGAVPREAILEVLAR